MQAKLTLRLDDKLIDQAKSHAKKSGKSLSRLVAEYFSLLGRKGRRPAGLPPTVAKLKGALRGTGVDEDASHAYLEKKHL